MKIMTPFTVRELSWIKQTLYNLSYNSWKKSSANVKCDLKLIALFQRIKARKIIKDKIRKERLSD